MSLAFILAASVGVVSVAPASAAAPTCGLDAPLYAAVAKGGGHQELLTPWKGERDSAVAKLGYSSVSVQWRVSTTAASELVAVHRLYKPSSNDFLYTYFPGEIKSAITRYGYRDQGVSFYASGWSRPCAGAAVYEGVNQRGVRNYSTDRGALTKAGFASITVKFFVRSVGTDTPAVSDPPPPTQPDPPKQPAPPTQPSNGKPAAITGTPFLETATATWWAYKRETNPTLKRMYYNVGATPSSVWFDGVPSGDDARLQNLMSKSSAVKEVPQIVLYGIPDRDCGSFARGGQKNAAAYRAWIDRVSHIVSSNRAIVIVEPDAIAFCNNTRAERTSLLTYVGSTFRKNNPNAVLYLHAGSGQLQLAAAAKALQESGIAYMRGFALNVASTGATSAQEAYGDRLVTQLASIGIPNTHFVIDTSRNGIGPQPNPGTSHSFCNNPNLALGTRPTSKTNDPNVDAYLWIRPTGNTDGACHAGDPASGFFPALVQKLVKNSIAHKTIDYWPLPND